MERDSTVDTQPLLLMFYTPVHFEWRENEKLSLPGSANRTKALYAEDPHGHVKLSANQHEYIRL